MKKLLFGLVALAAVSASAQDIDYAEAEIIVTGSRISSDDDDGPVGPYGGVPAVGLRRTADFALQPIVINGDTRDEARRNAEMYETIERAIRAASRQGVQLATGNVVVEPVTLDNYRDLTFGYGGRPDTSRIFLYVRTPLADTDAQAAVARVDAFVKSVEPVGRALVEKSGSLTLSVVGPDQYRDAIIQRVADDANAQAARFGEGYAVDVSGLHGKVQWTRASTTDVLLYIPYSLTVTPRS